jgi:hypothetical protein
LTFAIPDHPWVDSADGAAVRIAMTVGARGRLIGKRMDVIAERTESDGENEDLVVAMSVKTGFIHADLSVGTDITTAKPLRANDRLCSVGMKTIGAAFQIDESTAESLGLHRVAALEKHIRPYINGRDFAGTPRGIFVVDFFGMEANEVRDRFPAAFQYLLERAKPERDQNRNPVFRERWWVIGHPREQFRRAVAGLSRYIATIETAKHRAFAFIPISVTPDSTLVTFAFADAYYLGVLSSTAHIIWALAAGGRLGVGNDPRYNKTRCFEPFSFPAATDAQQARIRDLGEQLDAHRKRCQAAHPDLTLTGMYNVLEKLRAGETLTGKERTIHEHGLVSVVRQLHDELDAAVLEAYGWSDLLPLLQVAHNPSVHPERSAEGAKSKGTPNVSTTIAAQAPLSANGKSNPSPPNPPLEGEGLRVLSRDDAKRAFDEAILERLVALNAERAAEEARGLVRWLRPEFQHPETEAAPAQAEIETGAEAITDLAATGAAKPQAWPSDAIAQVRAVADALTASAAPLSVDDITARFKARGPWKKRVPALLDMLVALGRAHEDDGRYRAIP